MKYQRSITPIIQTLLAKKIVLLSGPRQVGKTYLAREFLARNHVYLNYDDQDDRGMLREKSWPRDVDLLILDELHKMPGWKTWLKAIYDKEGVKPAIIVTGSARMNTFVKGGDSLAGRHYHFSLLPLSFKELEGQQVEDIERMMQLGSFPEPYIDNDETLYKLWRKSHLERIIKEDLLDLERVQQLKKIEILVQLLAERVGSAINVASLARDLEVAPQTIKHWLQILEDLYVIFKVSPFSKNIAKAILKAPKYYFYDTGRVDAGQGAKWENLVALHLFKRNHFLQDTQGRSMALHYVRDKNKREVDFLTLHERQVEHLIEVKHQDSNLSPALKYYSEKLKPKSSKQVVLKLKRKKQFDSIGIVSGVEFLDSLET